MLLIFEILNRKQMNAVQGGALSLYFIFCRLNLKKFILCVVSINFAFVFDRASSFILNLTGSSTPPHCIVLFVPVATWLTVGGLSAD